MKPLNRALIFIILPTIAPLLFPPATLAGGLPVIGVAIVVFVLLGVLIWRGRSTALTLTIFIQGINVIVRLMMLFPHAQTNQGQLDIAYILVSVLSIGLSTYLLLRLDRPDVRSMMIA